MPKAASSHKRILLLSRGLGSLPEFIGKSPKGMKLALIPTAANPMKEVPLAKMFHKILSGMGFDVYEVDIAGKRRAELLKLLKPAEIIFVGGGLTFYLLEKMRESGFDKIIPKLLDDGAMYVGVSAGAVVAGADLKPIEKVDDPSAAPNLRSTKALALVDFVILPHIDGEDAETYKEVIKTLGKEFKLVPLKDDQAVWVEGSAHRIVKSPPLGIKIGKFTI